MKIRQIILFFITCLLIGCSSEDNFNQPNTTIKGALYDISSKGSSESLLIPGQSQNGARIMMYEEESNQPTSFWCDINGEFLNTRVFKGNYRVIPQGPFIVSTTDTAHVFIDKDLVVDFYLEPFLRIDATAELLGNSLNVNFKIEKSNQWDKSLEKYIVLYSWTKHVDVNSYIKKKEVAVDDQSGVLNQNLKFTLDDIDVSKPVFVRVAAITSGTTYYNYSKVMDLK